MIGEKRAVLIAGPTASGKSALALEMQHNMGGVIVNADSMQVYDVLRELTARPSAADVVVAPHLLYGFVSPAIRFSTGAWLAEVEKLIQVHDPASGPLIFVGGTGLYFDGLINGIAEMPPVPQAVVDEVEKLIQGLDRAGRLQLLAQRDPEMVGLLPEPDPQRLVRALAVKQATGRSLAVWQSEQGKALLEGWTLDRIVLNPDRDVLRARIAQRFETMMQGTAESEVRALLALKPDPSLPAMKAIGVREIANWLSGEVSQDFAIEKAIIATHQYAKRQRTWFRGRFGDWTWRE